MAESAKIRTKAPEAKQENAVSQTREPERSQSMNSPVERILFLQRTVGNRAVQRMMKSGTLQAKLTIGQPGDKYEQEADRVADQVMRIPEPRVQRKEEEEEELVQPKPLAEQITPLVQRQDKPEEEEEKEELAQAKLTDGTQVQRQEEELEEEEEEEPQMVQRQLEEKEEEEIPMVQRQLEEKEEEDLKAKEIPGQTPGVAPTLEARIQALKGGGQPLPKSVKAHFEPYFCYDLDQVRVHTNSKASHLARTINSRAFTVGQDVVFGVGEYRPYTNGGQRLLAHELTHVMQQISQGEGEIVQRGDPEEGKKKQEEKGTGGYIEEHYRNPEDAKEKDLIANKPASVAAIERLGKEIDGGSYGFRFFVNPRTLTAFGSENLKMIYEDPLIVRSGTQFGDRTFILKEPDGTVWYKKKVTNSKYGEHFIIKETAEVYFQWHMLQYGEDLINEHLKKLHNKKKLKVTEVSKEITTKLYFEYNDTKLSHRSPTSSLNKVIGEIRWYFLFPSFPVLESLVPPYKKRKVRILGFASREGRYSHNKFLSARRAFKIKELLEKEGIPKDKLEAIGMGVPWEAMKRPIGEYWKDRKVIFEMVPPIKTGTEKKD